MWIFWKSSKKLLTSYKHLIIVSISNYIIIYIIQKIRSYRSPITSLRGLVVTTDEPICSLHILLSTESNGGSTTTNHQAWHHPDDGLPHTLEHLVFLGSKTHPHKGILDKLANRCMADGTNAWTATDHTAYTLSTAGSEGAINLMPIFADHVLFPTLTDSGELFLCIYVHPLVLYVMYLCSYVYMSIQYIIHVWNLHDETENSFISSFLLSVLYYVQDL